MPNAQMRLIVSQISAVLVDDMTNVNSHIANNPCSGGDYCLQWLAPGASARVAQRASRLSVPTALHLCQWYSGAPLVSIQHIDQLGQVLLESRERRRVQPLKGARQHA